MPPTSFYVTYVTNVYEDGGYEVEYSNGTRRYYSRPAVKTDTLEYRQTSFVSYQRESNGTMVVFYRNGSIATFNDTGFVRWNVEPDVMFFTELNGGYRFLYKRNNFTVVYNKPVEEEETPRLKATTISYSEIFSNGTNRTVFRNGTIAIYNNRGQFVKFERPPSSFYQYI